MKCCWPPPLEVARQPLFVPVGKLQNFNYLHPLSNQLLNLSLAVTSRYSVAIIFPLSHDTYNELRQGKRDICQKNFKGIVKEIVLPDVAETLIYYLLSIQYLLPACYKHLLFVFKNIKSFMLVQYNVGVEQRRWLGLKS